MEGWQAFNRAISKDEVHKALFDMSPLKALGLDEFHVAFYQHMLDVVGDYFFGIVNSSISNGKLSEGMNDTLLVLIPKVKVLETIKQFRLISLCNVSYKAITKTITNRLEHIFPKVVRPFQSSFVPGRQISNNVLTRSCTLCGLERAKWATWRLRLI